MFQAQSPAVALKRGDVMATIPLHGKYAVGRHACAIVDDDMVVELSRWRWKAKPNGDCTYVYAVRNTTVSGKYVTIRMHRVVMGYDGPDDIDHLNHDSLDNRRENLRVATRSENVLNAKCALHQRVCMGCGFVFSWYGPRASLPGFHSEDCRDKVAHPPYTAVRFLSCKRCNEPFVARTDAQDFCCRACKTAWTRPHSSRVHFMGCVRCGSRFVGRSAKRKFCSSRCKDAAGAAA